MLQMLRQVLQTVQQLAPANINTATASRRFPLGIRFAQQLRWRRRTLRASVLLLLLLIVTLPPFATHRRT